MATSGTYNFGNTTVEKLITKAYQRVGIGSSLQTQEMIDSAKMSINLMFVEWVNRSLPLWPIQKTVITMNPGQASYELPPATVDIMEITKATLTRQLNGVAYSNSGGIAQNAFSGTPGLACTQTAPDGYISYNYGTGNTQSINYVGIQSNQNRNYNLLIQYSYDNSNWFTALAVGPQNYLVGQVQWYVLDAPPAAQAWRIQETGGAILDIQEIYFNVPNQCLPILRISRADYAYRMSKTFQAPPNSFLVNRIVPPILTVWPTPDSTFNYFLINYMRQIQDLNELNEQIDVPQYFFECFVNGLAARLAVDYAPDRFDMLNAAAENSYKFASDSDNEQVPINIQLDYNFK